MSADEILKDIKAAGYDGVEGLAERLERYYIFVRDGYSYDFCLMGRHFDEAPTAKGTGFG